MRRFTATLVLVTLVVASCGSDPGPWREDMVTASAKISEVDTSLPFAQLSDDFAAEAAVNSFCNSPTGPMNENDLEYVYAALTPLDARARLIEGGVDDAAIKELYEGLDSGMDSDCSGAKEAIFSYVPYSGWVDSLKCNIEEDFSFADTTDAIVQASCAG